MCVCVCVCVCDLQLAYWHCLFLVRFEFMLSNLLFCPAESKQQVLANLANFAYDPINYDYMRRLNILDLFLG